MECCECGGKIEGGGYADGSSVGDRILEGLVFDVRVNPFMPLGVRITCDGEAWADHPYLVRLNVAYWEPRILESVMCRDCALDQGLA